MQKMCVIDDYQNSFCVSRNGRGGGIMPFCKSNVTADVIEEFPYVSPVTEVLSFNVDIYSLKLAIVCVRSSPASGVNSFIEIVFSGILSGMSRTTEKEINCVVI